jgi:hypothetical protein
VPGVFAFQDSINGRRDRRVSREVASLYDVIRESASKAPSPDVGHLSCAIGPNVRSPCAVPDTREPPGSPTAEQLVWLVRVLGPLAGRDLLAEPYGGC